MPKARSRVQKRTRVAGTPLTGPEMLVNALNGENLLGRRGRDEVDSRLLIVVTLRFQRLYATLDTFKDADMSLHNHQELWNHLFKLNRVLARFRLTPSVDLRETGTSSHEYRLVLARVGRRQPMLEFARVQTLSKLATEGRLSSLKRCAQCNRWLYARFSHQRFCTDDCKEMFHRSNPDDKKRRREWARENYRIHNTKNVK